jgi:hypothetical protein
MIMLAYVGISVASFVLSIRITSFAMMNSGQRTPKDSSTPDILIALVMPWAIWSLKTIIAS